MTEVDEVCSSGAVRAARARCSSSMSATGELRWSWNSCDRCAGATRSPRRMLRPSGEAEAGRGSGSRAEAADVDETEDDTADVDETDMTP